MKPKVFIPEPISSAGYDLLASKVECVAPWREKGSSDTEKNRPDLDEYEAVIVRLFKISAEDLNNCARLKVIAKHGVGTDNIDLRATCDHGIHVVNTPVANSNAVAEHTLALLLALARNIGPAFEAVRAGKFLERNRFQGIELAGKSLGVIGLGRIGRKVARMATSGFSMKVIGYDPYLQNDRLDFPIERTDCVEEVFERSDFLTFHVPLNDASRHLVCKESMALVRPNCRIVNTSRGGVIDENALVEALEQGTLAGAALDVFEEEPLDENHPLCHAPNILLTPHISSSTQESLDQMAIDAAIGVLDVLAGKEPKYPVRTDGG
jgi:D-3-phosphoglycerate dehydrogenase